MGKEKKIKSLRGVEKNKKGIIRLGQGSAKVEVNFL